jgi:hypothetical protein
VKRSRGKDRSGFAVADFFRVDGQWLVDQTSKQPRDSRMHIHMQTGQQRLMVGWFISEA